MKILNGAEIAGYMKENQARQVRSLRAQKIIPKLAIVRNNDSPVIQKYVTLKKRYGEDIGVEVEDYLQPDILDIIQNANNDDSVHGIIVQLPLAGDIDVDDVVSKIARSKDVDGLVAYRKAEDGKIEYAFGDINDGLGFDSATATAINWLLAGYDIKLDGLKVALVGRGRLIGKPLEYMWKKSGFDVTSFGRNSDLNELKNFDVIISATGVPHLITPDLVKSGAVVVDAGTASEGGVLVGDVDEAVRERHDLTAITPKVGGVGPLTVSALFEHVLMSANRTRN